MLDSEWVRRQIILNYTLAAINFALAAAIIVLTIVRVLRMWG